VAAALSESLNPVANWIRARSGYADPKQSKAVRAYAVRLGFRKRSARLTAVEQLADLNDRTGVPALLQCLAKHRDDGPFLESVVRTLGKLGDERALPALRELTKGRHQSLMEQARTAVASIEPKSTLLRPAESADTLLRSATSNRESRAEELLRSSVGS
jgi:HEAT repeat protein